MTAKRRYDAPGRRAAAEATRDRICAAAEALFLRDGYARTTVRAVAREAGVAEATVYLGFATKADLLDGALLRALADNHAEPVAAVLRAPADEVLPRVAASHAATLQRAAPLMALGESAALMDAALRPMQARAHANLHRLYGAVVARLADGGLLRPGLTRAAAAETLFALCSEATYLRHPATGDAYAAWLTDVLERALLR